MKTYLTIVTLLLTFFQSSAQTQLNDSEIAKTMQTLADTTIIVQFPSVWNSSPQLYLLSKKGDTINTYIYQRPKYRKTTSKVPNGVARAIWLKDLSEYRSESVRINRYFTIKDTDPDTLRKLWDDVVKLQLWRTKDDAIEGSGCPTKKGSYLKVEDGGGVYILLISRAEIKPLNFYDPQEFEKYCPGRKGRQTAIKLSSMVYKIFKE
ncbi:hypothetical protein ACTJKN_14940 [Pedobacter sp. 22163]|uniref:hypothetical protein n=1 Tax=Pedobacter sp. 22163 TaxID=3453883 RepID=UPI003F845F49